MAERGVKSDHAPMDHWISFRAVRSDRGKG